MTKSQPLSLHTATVKPEYIDYNGHMNVAYYVLIFDEATDVYKDHVGIDRDYPARTNCTTFAAELHVTYLKEVHLGDKIRVETYLVDHDPKRHHFIHSMYVGEETELRATMEVMSLHISLEHRRVAPFPLDVQERIKSLHTEHSQLPVPSQVGHVMQIKKK